jgi:NADH dehydrogenase [ubiquinone] 1 alpha subcomplex assembly factor 1
MLKFYRINIAAFCLFFMIHLCTGGIVMGVEAKEKLIFGFDKPGEAEQWRTINDPVMGGMSQSSFQVTEKKTALFSGIVSLKNSGGFASVSSLPSDYNLSGFAGIAIRVKGDGKRYKFTIKTDTAFTGFTYQSPFSTIKGEWTVIYAPFKNYVPSFRGSVMKDAEPIDAKKVKSFGFLIADKQEGPFRLEIDWIKAYNKA